MLRNLVPTACVVLALGLVAVPAPAHGSWLAPTTLSQADQNAAAPQSVVNAAGDAAAVWTRSDGAHTRVQAAVRPSGQAWGAADTLSDAGANADQPKIAIDSAGNVRAVWRRTDGSNLRVQTASRPAGGSWSGADNLSDPGQDTEYPAFDFDQSGAGTAFWARSDGSHLRAQAATVSSTGVWGTPQTLSDPWQFAYGLSGSVGASGVAAATWLRWDGANLRTQAAVRSAAGVWGPATTLSDPGQGTQSTGVDVDELGNVVVAWKRADGTHARAQAAFQPAAGAWGAPQTLSAAGENIDTFDVSVGGGRAVAAWTRSDGANQRAQVSTSFLGGAWDVPTTVSSPGQAASAITVDSNASQNAVIAWSRSDGANTRVQAVQLLAGGQALGLTTTLSDAGQNATVPEITMTPASEALAAWLRSDGTNTRTQTAVLDLTAPQVTTQLPTTATVGDSVALNATVRDISVATSQWSFGDGVTTSGTTASHIYTAPGEYTVSLTTTDEANLVTTRTGTITVNAPTPVPGVLANPEPNTGATPPPAIKAPTPPTSTAGRLGLAFPTARRCIARPSLTVRATLPQGVRNATARVLIRRGGKTTKRVVKLTSKTQRATLRVKLAKITSGTVRVSVRLTANGHRPVTKTRTYRSCSR